MSTTSCNPCRCLTGTILQNKPKPCPVNQDCCLKACSGLIKAQDAVGPCGQSGVTDLSSISHLTGGCKGPLVFSLNNYDTEIFNSVTITKAGELTWTTKGSDTVGLYGEICFKIKCEINDDCGGCGILSSNGVMTIGIKDLCALNLCEECDVCDPCTGSCVPKDVNVAVNSFTNNSNITANA